MPRKINEYDYQRSTDKHLQTWAQMVSNPSIKFFVPASIYVNHLKTVLYMVTANNAFNQAIWLTKTEGQRDSRISAAIDRHLAEKECNIYPEDDSEFDFQNDYVIREMPEELGWE